MQPGDSDLPEQILEDVTHLFVELNMRLNMISNGDELALGTDRGPFPVLERQIHQQ